MDYKNEIKYKQEFKNIGARVTLPHQPVNGIPVTLPLNTSLAQVIRIEAAPTTPIMKRAQKRCLQPVPITEIQKEKKEDPVNKKLKICKIIGSVTISFNQVYRTQLNNILLNQYYLSTDNF